MDRYRYSYGCSDAQMYTCTLCIYLSAELTDCVHPCVPMHPYIHIQERARHWPTFTESIEIRSARSFGKSTCVWAAPAGSDPRTPAGGSPARHRPFTRCRVRQCATAAAVPPPLVRRVRRVRAPSLPPSAPARAVHCADRPPPPPAALNDSAAAVLSPNKQTHPRASAPARGGACR